MLSVSLPKRTSPRWNKYDYSSAGGYFVTICTKNREHYFGEIVDGKMILNELGKVCERELLHLLELRKYCEIHEYVIMPNHIHLLLIVSDGVGTRIRASEQIEGVNGFIADRQKPVPTDTPKRSLGSIIGNFKSAVTRECNKLQTSFVRQSRYHDHIIRTAQDYERIAHYIQTNPANWDQDIFYI